MSVIHLKKKDIVKSKVRGVDIEFNHEKLATILGIPGNNEICEYVKDVWEESKYIKPLEITRSGDNRRKDDDVDAPEGQAEKEDERNKDDFDWEAVIDEAAVEGESGSGERFYDAEDETQGSPEVRRDSSECFMKLDSIEGTRYFGVDPSGLYGEFRKVELLEIRVSLKEKGQTDFMMIWRRRRRECQTSSLTSPSPIQTTPLDFLA
ncbi:hypothetical protein Dimus_023234 [Dionaea muscipula]